MVFLSWIVFCCLVGALASNKGRSFWAWTLISAAISPLLGGIVLAIVLLMSKDK